MPEYRRCLVAGATYFFTVTVAHRPSTLLVQEIDRLRHAYVTIANKLPFTTVAICVMPDHIHALWTLPPGDADYSIRWSQIKAGFSRGLPLSSTRSASLVSKRERGVWQRRFWEHQVRDEEDLRRHIDYIHFNPVKHGYVQAASNWRFS